MKYTKLLNNHVLVQVDSLWADTIKLQSGMVLFIDTSTQNPRYATTHGTVVQVPDKLVCIRPKNQNALEWETICELKPGDQVWFQYDAMIAAVKDPRLHWVENDKLYVLMNYRWMYVAQRWFEQVQQTEVICLNGYCLCEPVYADEYPKLAAKYLSSDLVVDKLVKIPNVVRILYFALPNIRYQDKVYSDDMVVLAGDIVLTAKHSDVPLEYELYRSFDKDREIYRIQRRYMLAVVDISE